MVPSIEQEIHDLHALIGSPLDPEGRAFVPLADAYRRAGDPSRARDILAKGLSRHPRLAAAHLVSGWVSRDLADDRGAEEALLKVLELDRDNARALVGLGRLLLAGGHQEGGQALLERGLALDPRLASEGTPDRVPRHSENPEMVGTENPEMVGTVELAPMDWEVLPDETSETVIDLAALAPDPAPDPEMVPTPEDASVADLDHGADGDPTEDRGPDVPDDRQAMAPPSAALAAPSEPERAADPVEAAEFVPLDAEDELIRGDRMASPFDEPPEADLDEAWAGGGLDIEWEVESFYQSDEAAGEFAGEVTDEAAGEVADVVGGEAAPEATSVEGIVEPDLQDPFMAALADVGSLAPGGGVEAQGPPVPEPEPVAEAETDVVVDAWSLAPDGWTPASHTGDDEDELLMELADLAPDVEPHPEPDVEAPDLAPEVEPAVAPALEHQVRQAPAPDTEAALPTRTLGELYARQGLIAEAVEVYRALVRRSPDDAGLRSRLAELDAGSGGPTRLDRASVGEPARSGGLPDDTVGRYLGRLLSWGSAETGQEGGDA